MKRSSSAVFLMELTLVILFFSLSAVVTLRLFVTAHHQEQQSTLRSDALELAENTAELFRIQGTACFAPADGWKTAAGEEGTTIYTYGRDDLLLQVSLQEQQTDAGKLTSGEVQVKTAAQADGQTNILCRLPVARYDSGRAAS